MMPLLVDSHCHLDFPDFEADLDAVVSRAKAVGVGTLVTICTELRKFPAVLDVARRYDHVYCTVGVHPHEAGKDAPISAAALIAAAQHPKVIGIGETGLDFHYCHSPRADQELSFRVHIEAARATGLPVIVHSREAEEATAALLREERAKGPFRGVMHCFSSKASLADTALDLGLYISLSGIVTFKNADELRSIAAGLPPERLLVETDAPYLAPVPHRGKRNEPALIVHTARQVAALKDLEFEELARVSSNNFFTLFDKARPPERRTS